MKRIPVLLLTTVFTLLFLVPTAGAQRAITAGELAGNWSGRATLAQNTTDWDADESAEITLEIHGDGGGTITAAGVSGELTCQGGEIRGSLSHTEEAWDEEEVTVKMSFDGTATGDDDWITIEGKLTVIISNSPGSAVYTWSAQKGAPPAGEEPEEDDIPALTDGRTEGTAGEEDDGDPDLDSWNHDWSPAHIPDQAEESTGDDHDQDWEDWDWDDWTCGCEDPWEKHAGSVATVLIGVISAIAAALGGAAGGAAGSIGGTLGAAGDLAGTAASAEGEGIWSGDPEHGDAEGPDGPPEGQAPGTPETMELVVDHKGTRVEYVRDPVSGDWINPLTGGALNPAHYGNFVIPALEANREFDANAWQRNVEGTTGFDWALNESEIERIVSQEKLVKQLKLERLEQKYGVKGEQAVRESHEKAAALEREWSEKWMKISNNLATAEETAEYVDWGVDAGLHGASYIVPGGKAVYIGYKGVRGFAGTLAEKGVSTKTLVSGTVRGASDALRVYANNPYAKAAVSFAGETAAGGIEGGWKGLGEGAAKGATKAVVLGVTDKLGKASDAQGDAISKALFRGVTKFHSNLVHDRIIKPTVSKALK